MTDVIIEDVFRDVSFVDGVMVNGVSAEPVRKGDVVYVDKADGERVFGEVGMIPFPGKADAPPDQVSFEIAGALSERIEIGDRVVVVAAAAVDVSGTLDRLSFDAGGIELVTPLGRVRLAGSAVAAVGDGVDIEFDAEAAGSMAPHLVKAVGSAIAVSIVDSALHVTLGEPDAPMTVVVPPLADFEAWEIVADDGARVVCGPGGQLVSWGPAEADSSD